MYTWALNAKGVEFLDGVGIRVGGDTHLNYLVVQVHYNIESNEVDSVFLWEKLLDVILACYILNLTMHHNSSFLYEVFLFMIFVKM